MERQNRLLTGLAIVLLVLVGIIVLQNRDGADRDRTVDLDAPSRHDLFDFDKDTVVSVTLTSAKGELRFEKLDGGWKMTAPRELAVDEYKVTEILNRFDSIEVEERPLTGDLATFGLDEAQRVEVRFGGGEGKTWTVWVGTDTAVGYRSYALTDPGGDPVLLTSEVADLVRRSADDFRSKDLWTFSAGTVRRVRVDAAEGSVVLRKDDHGWWLGDDGPRADEDAVRDWLYRLESLRGASFVDGADRAALGLEPPAARVTVEDDAGTHELRLGPPDPSGRAAVGTGDVMRLAADAEDPVRLTGWVSPRLVPVRRIQIDRLELTLGDKKGSWTRKDGTWTAADGTEARGVDDLLDKLEKVAADRTAAGVAAPASAWGRVVLGEGESRSETVEIGPAGPDGVHAARDLAGGPPFTVKAADLQPLLAGW